MMMWCSNNVNANDIMPTWHEWNANADDIMMRWFSFYVNPSDIACPMCTCMHGGCALCKTIVSKYLHGLACMQANLNLVKVTASHFWVLNTQKANLNMPNMIPLHISTRNCNENLAWGTPEPLVQSYVFWYKTKGDKTVKTSFFSCSNDNF